MSDAPIEVKYSSRRSLLTCAQTEGERTTLFVPTTGEVTGGLSVRLKVTLGDANRSFTLAGRVMPGTRPPGSPPGFVLLMASPEERRAWGFVHGFCSRNQDGPKRYPTLIMCKVSSEHLKLQGSIRDLSMTGAFVAVKERRAFRIGAPVTIRVKSGLLGLGSTDLQGEVIWVGSKDSMGGIGVHFRDSTTPVMELMRKHELR